MIGTLLKLISDRGRFVPDKQKIPKAPERPKQPEHKNAGCAKCKHYNNPDLTCHNPDYAISEYHWKLGKTPIYRLAKFWNENCECKGWEAK